MLLLFRLIHIISGAFWAGVVWFAALYLVPAIRDSGPEGGKVMGALQRRGMLNLVPALAVLTVLSGLLLYWRVSAGFQASYMRSRPGMAYGTGMIAALAAMVVGIGVLRPSIIASMTAEPAKAQALRARAAMAGLWAAGFVALAVAAMAVGRYL